VTFLPRHGDETAAGNLNGHARILWSPILLSLPTPMGFSGGVVSDVLDVRPSLDAPTRRARYLERREYAAPPPDFGLRLGDLQRLVPLSVVDGGGVVFPREREAGLTVLPADGPATPELVDTPWPEAAHETGDWDLTARLLFDPDGTVRAVLIEDPAGEPSVNRRAARALRRWRATPGPEGGERRILLRHVADTSADAPGGTQGP
jgi:hypothetical protein